MGIPVKEVTGYIGVPSAGAQSGATTLTFNSADVWGGFSFVPRFSDTSKTLNKVLFRIATVVGVLGSGDISCALYSQDSAGKPASQIEVSTTVSSTPTGAAWVEVSGFSSAVTRGERYYLVFRNLNATPSSNYFSIAYQGNTGGNNGFALGVLHYLGWSKVHSTDSGVTWGNSSTINTNFRLEYSDGTFEGMANRGCAYVAGTAIYGSGRKSGGIFTSLNATMNVIGIAMTVGKLNNPSTPFWFELYNDTTLLGQTAVTTSISVSYSGIVSLYFPEPIVLPANTANIRVVMARSDSSDTVSNAWFPFLYIVDDGSAATQAMRPFNGTLRAAYYDGSSWTNNDNYIPVITLLLDTNGEFTATGSGGAGMSKARIVNVGG